MATANPGDLYKDIEKLSTCALCLEIYCEPRHLPCMHAFCTKCLHTLLDSATTAHKPNIACPTCRLEVPVQDVTKHPVAFICNSLTDTLRSFQSLSGNENICHYCEEPFAEKDDRWVCTDCIVTMCLRCRKQHSKAPSLASHTVKNKSDITDSEMEGLLANQTRLCADHNKALEFLCETCKKLLCVSCALVDHNSCSKKEVTTVIGEHRKMLQHQVDQRKLEIDKSNKRLEKLKCTENSFDKSVNQAKKHVADTAKKLKHEIEQIEENLVREIEGKASSAKKTFKEVREEEMSFRDKAAMSVQYAEMSMRTGTPVDIIQGNLQSSDASSKVTTMVERKTLTTLATTSINFVGFENVNLQKAFGTFAVKSLKQDGVLKYTTIVSKTIDKSHNGISETDKGTFCLCHPSGVDIYNEAGDFVKSLITQKGLFDVCSAVGFIYVVAQKDKTLHVYKQSGELVKSMPVAVSSNAGIAYWEGDLYVSNWNGNNINKLAGVNTSNVKTSTILQDAVSTPYYIAVNSDIIVVSCFHQHQIKVFNKLSLQLLFTYGEAGSGPNQLYCPWGVCIDILGNILIVDCTNSRVHVLDPDGKLLNHIKTTFAPSAICVNSNMQLNMCKWNGNTYCKVEYYFE